MNLFIFKLYFWLGSSWELSYRSIKEAIDAYSLGEKNALVSSVQGTYENWPGLCEMLPTPLHNDNYRQIFGQVSCYC